MAKQSARKTSGSVEFNIGDTVRRIDGPDDERLEVMLVAIERTKGPADDEGNSQMSETRIYGLAHAGKIFSASGVPLFRGDALERAAK